MKFSVIIPFSQPSEYLYECLDHLKKQSSNDLEIILVPDEKEKYNYPYTKVFPTGQVGPAEKRDVGSRKAAGEILSFIDDDAYPDKDWLKNASEYFKDKDIAAVCGPGVTPPSDDVFRQASGWVSSLWIGSGGAGMYRFTPQKKREVDDFPSMNFLVRKSDFIKAGGFDTHFWPGEDTKLCFNLVYKLKKKIIYDPKVLVFHHRKPLFIPHLRQISRFAVHRGHFARILPKTSLRLGYLIPTLFNAFLIVGLPLALIDSRVRNFWITGVLLYFLIIISNMIYIRIKTKSILIAVLTGFGIIFTHIIYGLLFPVGYFKRSLKQ